MGRHKKIEETELAIEEESFEVNNVKSSISKLSGKHIIQFVGETYKGSIHMAFEWANRINDEKSTAPYFVEIVDYFPQKHGNKAILVSYNIELR